MDERTGHSPTRLIDIAAKAGVSTTVVSIVLRGGSSNTVRVSEKTAQRVRMLARDMGYQPNVAAQQLKGRASDVVGVLIGAESTAANYERLSAIEQEAYRRGLRLMIGQFHAESERAIEYVQDFVSRGVNAVICFHNPLPQNDARLQEWLKRVPGLVFQTEALLPGACCVDVDRAQGVRDAMAHLVRTGRQRIALVINSSDDPLMHDRLRGYRAGLRDAGRPLRPELVFAGTGTFPPTRNLLESAIDAMILNGKADAIIASNDVWALELIKAMRRRGIRVPTDVAVIGFDNLPAAALADPELTTIDQNNKAFAAAALDLLIESLSGETMPACKRRRIVNPILVIRQSA